ncbi:MAG: hypothetical protein ACFNXZ_05530 [Lautropia mirabilis]
MHVEKRTALHPLTLAITLALAACGGGQDTPQTDTGGLRTKAATDLTVTAQDSSATPHANASGRTTKEAVTPDTPPIANSKIRGDVLIQAFLSQTSHQDAQGRDLTAWLPPNHYYASTHGMEPPKYERFSGPVMLSREDIVPADGTEAGLGSPYTYRIDDSVGPTRNPAGARTTSVDAHTIRLGLSAPGLPNRGASANQAIPLQLDIAARVIVTLAGKEFTLQSANGQTIRSDQTYETGTTSEHEWRNGNSHPSARLYYDRASEKGFRICLDLNNEGRNNGILHTRCNEWEVPEGWKPGQPLVYKALTYENRYTNYDWDTATTWNWNNLNEPRYVPTESLKTATQAVNQYGISGAQLAAMFDSTNDRNRDMMKRRLADYADAISSSDAPQRISLTHQSTGAAYANGGKDNDDPFFEGYSPAIGNYQYTFATGSYQDPQNPRVPHEDYPQVELAMQVNHDLSKGFTLPNQLSLNFHGIDRNSKQAYELYKETPLQGTSARTFTDNQLIPFGSTLQSWATPNDEASKKKASVWLTLEQSQWHANDVDLCWHVNATDEKDNTVADHKYCTTWLAKNDLDPNKFGSGRVSGYGAEGRAMRWRTK